MSKATPNPRNADDASAHEKIDPQKPDEATQSRADEDLLSNADIRATRRTPPTMFIVNPDVHVIDLLGSVSESLASASVTPWMLPTAKPAPVATRCWALLNW